MKLKFTIKGQELKCQTPSIMVSDSVHYFGADFSFLTKAWEGLEKYAHFSDGENLYDVLITDDSIAEGENMNFKAGTWTCWVHGAKREGTELKMQIVTSMVSFKVEQAGAIDGDVFPTVLPSVGEQIIARASEQAERAEDAAEDAEASADNAMRMASNARTNAVSAETSATNANRSAESAGKSEQNALEYSEEAETFADRAEDSMFHAETFANNAKTAETEARKAEQAAKQAAEEAKHNTYDDTELRGLIADNEKEIEKVNETTSELYDGLANLSKVKEPKRFTAIFNTTSFDDVKEAYDNGLIVDLYRNVNGESYNYTLFDVTTNIFSFARFHTGTVFDVATIYKPTNRWSAVRTDLSKYLLKTEAEAQYKPKEKEWVLKGTLTTEYKDSGVNVDLSGCTEMIIKGTGVATGNTNIYSYDNVNGNRFLVYNAFTTSRKSVLCKFANAFFGLENIYTKYGSAETLITIADNGAGYSWCDGRNLQNINRIMFSIPSNIISCNIEIYAR